jgi:hypothetical protein
MLLLGTAAHTTKLTAQASGADLPAEQFDNTAFYYWLEQLQEPDLFKQPATGISEVYRFTAIPFRKLKTSVRIDVSADGTAIGRLKTVEFNAADNPVLKSVQFDVTSAQLAQLRSALDAMNFWSMRAHDGHYDETGKRVSVIVCADGDGLYLEAKTRRGYHGVSNGCPKERTEQMTPALEVFKDIARPFAPKGPRQYFE